MHLLSWNIQWGCGCDERVSFPRIGVIRQMGEFDVICLQEVAVNHPALTGSKGEDQVAVLGDSFPGYSIHYAIGSDLAGVGPSADKPGVGPVEGTTALHSAVCHSQPMPPARIG